MKHLPAEPFRHEVETHWVVEEDYDTFSGVPIFGLALHRDIDHHYFTEAEAVAAAEKYQKKHPHESLRVVRVDPHLEPLPKKRRRWFIF